MDKGFFSDFTLARCLRRDCLPLFGLVLDSTH